MLIVFWVLLGTEDLPFVQTWTQVLKKRGILTLIWIVGAAIVAGLLTMPLYKRLEKAKVTCLDYSADMMENAEKRAVLQNGQDIF